MAIPLPKRNLTAFRLVSISFGLIILNSLFVLLILLSYTFFCSDPVDYILYFIPILAFLVATVETLSMWHVRSESFRILARSKLIQRCIDGMLKIGISYISLQSISLIIAFLVSQCASLVVLSRGLLFSFKNMKIKEAIFLAKYYFRLVKYRLPSQMLMVIAMQSLILFSTFEYGANQTGQLALALLVINLPVSLIGTSIANVYFSSISKIGKKQPLKIKQLTDNLTLKLGLASLFPMFILIFLGEKVFTVIFGEAWERAGEIACVLCYYIVGQLITTPVINVLTIFEKNRLFMMINIRRLLLLLCVYIYSVYVGLDFIDFIFLYSVVLCLHYILILFEVKKIINHEVNKAIL